MLVCLFCGSLVVVGGVVDVVCIIAAVGFTLCLRRCVRGEEEIQLSKMAIQLNHKKRYV